MEKWQGSFAKNQLEKFGWENGDGLGKNKDGRVKHITVTKKNDTKGVGVGQNQWEFAWWDHLYNKSASEVAVEKDNESESVKVAKKGTGLSGIRRSTTGIISTHRPTGKTVKTTTTTTSMSQQADLINNDDNEKNVNDMVKDVQESIAQRIASTALYSGFVKSASGVYDPSIPSTPEAGTTDQSNDDDDDDDDDDELKDYSIKVTDEELFKACEGRTARKGGRGLVEQKGKFARVMKEYLRNEDVDSSSSQKRMFDDDSNEDKSVKKAKKEKKDKKEKKAKKEKKPKKEKKEKKEKKVDKKDGTKEKKKKDNKEKKKKKKD